MAALYAGRPDFPLPKLVEDLVTSESVPFLPALRYKPSGLTKRQVWERTWDLQRREDAGEDVGPIPVPPKYTSADFLTSDIWRLRGKLDVPKERFVSYPHCARDGDPSLVVGWAGWDHLRQAQALTSYYERMKSREGWPAERLVPLLAGLDGLVPWLLQWHNEVDPEYDLRMGDYYRDFVRDEAQGARLYSGSDQGLGAPGEGQAHAGEEGDMSAEHGTNTFTIELPEDVLTKFAETPEAFARELRLAAAIEWYREGRVSQGKGAAIAGVSRVEFIEALGRAKVPASQVSADELMEEVDRAVEANRGRVAPDPADQGGAP